MDRIRSGLLAAALALVALPASAAAAPYVPPGNSAATQYTEAVPTAGGPKATNKGKQGKQTPSKVLGAGNAKKLDARGPEGQAAAEVAAATAPATVQAAPAEATGTPGNGEPGQTGSDQGRRSASSEPDSRSSGANAPPATNPTHAQAISGSSGLGEVVSQATGTSSGQLGLLLPLLIVAVVIWSIAYLLRQRRRQAA